jgi:hypothetical protein
MPKSNKITQDKMFSLRIDGMTYANVILLAERDFITKAAMIRKLIRLGLKNYPPKDVPKRR